jgi:hypothetical protein
VDKAGFIHWLFDQYQMNDNEYDLKFNQYFKHLRNDLNFKGLQAQLLTDETTELPSCITLNNMTVKVIVNPITDHRTEALRHIEAIQKEEYTEMKDFDNYLKEKIRSFCTKNGITPCFDK